MTYSIDTSALLDGWRRYYPPDVFPRLWRRLEELIDAGELIATEEILRDLEKKDDDVYAWVKEREGFLVPIDDEIQIAVAALLERFPRLVNTQRGRSLVDPWVIAVAQVKDAVVVNGEHRSHNLDRPKIPDVCDALGIRCISLLDLMRELGWTFSG